MRRLRDGRWGCSCVRGFSLGVFVFMVVYFKCRLVAGFGFGRCIFGVRYRVSGFVIRFFFFGGVWVEVVGGVRFRLKMI